MITSVEINAAAQRVIIRREYQNGFTSILDPTFAEIAVAATALREHLERSMPPDLALAIATAEHARQGGA